jgi:5-methylcytosine-specific restriction endonuclease McrA
MSHSSKLLHTRTWQRVRLRVLARDAHTCAYCGEPANEVDHVVPISVDQNQAYDMDNLVACCRRCNNLKGAKNQAVFLSRSLTPPAFISIISPSDKTNTTIFNDFGSLND